MHSLVRFNQRHPKPVFKSFIDDLFNINFNDFTGDFARNIPSVNVKETDDAHILELAAPGLEKEDFKVNIDKQVLTISVEKEDSSEDKTEKFTRKEFSFSSFKRTFHLPETINTSEIVAEYKSGILSVTLPKKEEAKETPARTIDIG